MKKIFLLFLFFVGLNFSSGKLFCTQEEAVTVGHSIFDEATYLQFFEKQDTFVNLYFDVINKTKSFNCSYEEGCKNTDRYIESMTKLLGQELLKKLLNIVFVETTYGYHLFEPYKKEVRTTALDVLCNNLTVFWDFELWFYYNYAISKLIECGAKKYEQLNTGIPTEVIYENI